MVKHHLSREALRFFGSLFALLWERAPGTGKFRASFIRVFCFQSRGEPVVPLGKPLETLPKAVGWLYVGKSPKLCGHFTMMGSLEPASPRHTALQENVRSASSYRHLVTSWLRQIRARKDAFGVSQLLRVVGKDWEPRRQRAGRSVGRMIGDYDDPETWRERARDARAAADKAKDSAARATLLWTAERYYLAEIARDFAVPASLLQ